MSKISVIVPVYKVEKYISRCVNSILNQTFDDFELILIDDGSPDRCGEICDEYARVDGRVRVIHQDNKGLSAARNAGIDWTFLNSDSQWLSFIDSDDWVHETYLEKLLRAVIDNNVSISLCEFVRTTGENVENITENEDDITRVISTEEFYVNSNTNATIACGKLYKKSCFQSVRYPVGKIHEDESVTHRILFEFEKIAVVKEPLYSYYINPEGITKSEWNPRRLDSVKALEEQVIYMKKHGYRAAHKYALKKYVVDLTNQIVNVKAGDKGFQNKYLFFLKRKLKKTLLRYPHIIKFNANTWIYECAFPKLMSIYWIGKAQCNKFKKQ